MDGYPDFDVTSEQFYPTKLPVVLIHLCLFMKLRKGLELNGQYFFDGDRSAEDMNI